MNLPVALFASISLFVAQRALAQDSDLRPILAFGDSLTYGIGGAGDSYPEALSRLIERPVLSRGHLGEVSADSVGRLQKVLDQSGSMPSLMILCIGTNDLLQGVPARDLLANIRRILAIARSKDVPVLLLSVAAVGQRRAHPLFDEIETSEWVRIDRDSLPGVAGNPLYKSDLVHLNADGYRELAQRVRDTLIALTWPPPL